MAGSTCEGTGLRDRIRLSAKMNIRIATVIAIILATTATSSLAQSQGAISGPEAKLALARQVVALINPTGLTKRSIQPMLDEMRSGANLQRSTTALHLAYLKSRHPEEWIAAFRRLGAIQANFTEKAFDQAAAAALSYAIEGYAREFSTEELRELIAFYRSPIGIQAREKQPIIGSGASKVLQDKMNPVIQEKSIAFYPQVEVELRKLIMLDARK